MITDRLMLNPQGNTFLPRNTEGSSGANSSKFWTTTKGTIAFVIAIVYALLLFWSSTTFSGIIDFLVKIIITLVFIFAVRMIVIEEHYLKRVFNRIDKVDKSTSGVNYGIMYYNNRENGCSVGFIDGIIGVFVSFERESIVGRPADYAEQCDDSFSDFLNNIYQLGYSIVKCCIMENASVDPRFVNLKNQIAEVQNPAVRKILQLNYSSMFKLAENAFYEQDVFLIYTKNSLKINDIIDDVLNVTSPLLQKVYSSRKILKEADINDLHSICNGVEYFDSLTAKNEAFENLKSKRKFNIYSIKLKNGNEFVLTEPQIKKLNKIYYEYLRDPSIKVDIINELLNESSTYNPDKQNITKDYSKVEVEEFIPLKLDEEENSEEPTIDLEQTPVKKELTQEERKQKAIDEEFAFDL